jgi:hypothetical protein
VRRWSRSMRSDRRSRAGRFREGRLRGVRTYGVACPRTGQTGAPRQAHTGILVAARSGPSPRVARPEGSRAVPGSWCSGPGSCVDQMEQISRVIVLGSCIVLEVRLSLLLEPSHPRPPRIKSGSPIAYVRGDSFCDNPSWDKSDCGASFLVRCTSLPSSISLS